MKFTEFDLNQDLLKGIEKAGFEECMEVQERVLPNTLAGRDVFVQSQTGSGKTAAFLITILELFHRDAVTNKRAVIIAPTRELAIQIEREAKVLGAYVPYAVGSFYGGVGYGQQKKMLAEDVEIITGTPGRLIDLNQSGVLDFRDTAILVVDEADRMFDMGFIPDLRKILRKMPPREKRMTMLFSATMNTRVFQLAWEHTNDPVEIIVNPEKLTVDDITQEVYHVARNEKMRLLLGVLQKESPDNALIFTNTKQAASEIAQRLSFNGYNAEYIMGDLPQAKRTKLIDRLKSGELRFLVATDVAARGLHIDELDMVINYDLPEDSEAYVHRIGRTARAGHTGKAVSLACERFVYSLESIEELIGAKIPVVWPDENTLVEDKSVGMRIERPDRRGDRRPERRRGSARRGPRKSSGRGSARENSPSGERPNRNAGRDSRSRSSGSGSKPQTAPAGASNDSSRDKAARTNGSRSDGPRSDGPRSDGPRSRQRPDGPHAASRREGPRPAPRTNDGKPTRGGKKDGGNTSKRNRRGDSGVSREQSMEDRLAYYREKYGEDFEPVDSSRGSAKPQRSEDRPQKQEAEGTAGKRNRKGLKTIFGRIFKNE